MKHILLLLLGLSSLPLLAQRSAVFEKSKCSMYLYNQDSTSLELMKSSFKARKVETIVVEYQCVEEADRFLDGATLYLVVVDFEGKELIIGGPNINIEGNSISTYADATYELGKGVRFEVNLPEGTNWKRGSTCIFYIYTGEKELRRKVILLN